MVLKYQRGTPRPNRMLCIICSEAARVRNAMSVRMIPGVIDTSVIHHRSPPTDRCTVFNPGSGREWKESSGVPVSGWRLEIYPYGRESSGYGDASDIPDDRRDYQSCRSSARAVSPSLDPEDVAYGDNFGRNRYGNVNPALESGWDNGGAPEDEPQGAQQSNRMEE